MLRALGLLLLLCFAAPAWSATPVQLPPGEPVDPWRAPLALAGLAPGSGRPGVEILAQGDRWVIVAWDASGVARAAELRRPTTPAEREDLAWLATSLLRGGAAPRLSQLPRPPPPPPPPPARAGRAPPPPRPARPAQLPEPEPLVAAEPLAAPAPAPTAPAVIPAPPAPRNPEPAPPATRPSLHLGAAALSGLRLGQVATGGVGAVARAGQGAGWADLSLYALFSGGLPSLDSSSALNLWGASGSAGWRSTWGPLEPGLGGGLSLNRLRFQESGWPRQAAWDPALHLDALASARLWGQVDLALGLRAGLDLRKITFYDSDGEAGDLGRLWLWPSLTLLWSVE